jgi:4-amino-4-deoxy-L-arabinose transferase-like glycosyltransferase
MSTYLGDWRDAALVDRQDGLAHADCAGRRDACPADEAVAATLGGRRWAAVSLVGLALTAGVLVFFGLGGHRVLGRHEILAVAPAEAMLRSGDWILPDYGGEPRLEKPPLGYWSIAVAGAVCGEVNAWTARLPAALSAVALAALLGVWAARWYGRPVGVATAFVQLSSLWAVVFARKAEVDMLLCLLTTSALFLVAFQPDDERGRRAFLRWTGIYALLALSWLAKFHYGLAMVLIPTVVYYAVERRWRSFTQWANPVGLALVAAAVVVWPWLVTRELPNAWDVWQAETVGRAFGEIGHERPVWYFLPKLLWMALPWTPVAALAVSESWRQAWRDRCPRERFLWIWFVTQFVVLSLSVNKHKHYLMAALPVVSVLGGRGLWLLVRGFATGRFRVTRLRAGWLTALCLLGGAAMVLVVHRRWPELTTTALVGGAVFAVVGSAAFWLLAWGRTGTAVAVTLVNLLVGSGVVVAAVLPVRDPWLPMRQIAEEIREHAGPDRTVCAYRLYRNGMLHFLGQPAYCRDSLDDFALTLTPGEPAFVVGWTDYVRELERLGRLRVVQTWPYSGGRDFPNVADLSFAELTP